MGIFDMLKTTTNVASNESYNFLVVAALQEELNEFYKLDPSFSKMERMEGDCYKVTFNYYGHTIKVLTYSADKMGMPFNAASIMRIINIHQPYFTLFIGTCASIGEKKELGDVLIPHRIFSYESGKYDDGIFKPDFYSYETGETLRKQANLLYSRIEKKLKYKVSYDDDFSSGGAVIDDDNIVAEIEKRSGRKLSGLDMEAYSIGCINFILKPSKELLVIKGISDYARKKSETEQQGNKELARKNAAEFTFELIKHLDSNVLGYSKEIEI